MTDHSISTEKKCAKEPLWHVRLAVVVALALQLALPDLFVVGPKYALPVLELLLLVALTYTTPRQPVFRSVVRRVNAVTLIGLITVVNVFAVQQLVSVLLQGSSAIDGRGLILTAMNIYVTNIIIFGLWFWELDGGGHGSRREKATHERDFLFAQMSTPTIAPHGWEPTFLDYLYISVTNATAFSPTDALPLTRRAKMLMALQAFISLITIALVAARAVNILK